MQKPIKKQQAETHSEENEQGDDATLRSAEIIAPQFGKKRRRYRGNRKRKDGVAEEGNVANTLPKTDKPETSKKKNWLRRLLD